MNGGTTRGFLLGTVFGAAVMYLVNRREQRVLQARDQVVSALGVAKDVVAGRAEDLSNRARGVAAEATARLRHEPVNDQVLAERVRAQLGRLVTNQGVIEVTADQGRVTLRGPIDPSEADELVKRVGWLRGVDEVINQLDVQPAQRGADARPQSGDDASPQGSHT